MNRTLIFGLLGIAVLLFLMIFGPSIAPYTMNQVTAYKLLHLANGQTAYQTLPFPPSSEHWLGTDLAGRDMLTVILYGARVTLTTAVSVAILRVLLAFPLAYLSMTYPRTLGWVSGKLSLAFTTVPAALIVFLISTIFNFSDVFSKLQNLMIMGFLIMIVGLFPTTEALRGKMESIQHHPFMDGLQAIGARRWRIFRKHMLPHISSFTIVLFVSEIAQTLWLAGQLAVINVFLGGGILVRGEINMRYPEEWAGVIGFTFRAFAAHPIVVINPVCALTFSILTFNLLAEGLRKQSEQKWGI